MLLHGRVIPTDEVIAKIDNVSKDDILKAAQYLFSSQPTYTLLGDLKQYPDYDKLKQYLPRI